MIKEALCGNCRFWIARSFEECHRYAPRPKHWQWYGLALALTRGDPEALEVVGNDGSKADWPRTRAEDWCGEHEFTQILENDP